MGVPRAIGSPISAELLEVQIQRDEFHSETRWCAVDESLFNDSSRFERVHEKRASGTAVLRLRLSRSRQHIGLAGDTRLAFNGVKTGKHFARCHTLAG